MTRPFPYLIDPDDPRSPTTEQWALMSEQDRARIVASLPAEVPFELFMPEGDPHRKAKNRAVEALDRFFKRIGRRVYVSSELGVYYPDQPRFAPDVLAVLDVEPHERDKWVVLQEGKGLDLVLEIHVSGDVRKDYELNRKRYAALGVPEYFLFDRTRGRLAGWRLPLPHAGAYEPIIPQLGWFPSHVLGMDLALEADRLRFYYGGAPVPEAEDLIARLESMVGSLVERRETEREQREAAERERDAEREQREAAERERESERERREAAERERESERERREAAERKAEQLEADLNKLRRG